MKSTKWTVLPFVSGLTSQSNSAFDIVENTVYFLEDKLGIKEHYTDETDRMTQQRKLHSVEEWRKKLAELCWRYTETGKKLLIMVDAVDQLTQSEERDKLYFIPTNINENIHFVMTCTTDFETNGRNFYTLKEISAEDKRDVISGTLSRISRELSENVVNAMVKEKASSNPLYLSLLIQRLTMMNIEDFTKISKDKKQMAAIEKQHIKIIEKCAKNLEDMSAELLHEVGRRIENPELVSRAGQYLAVSREGLRKKDLAVLLGEIWTEVDFSHFINYMYDSFMLRDDGRYDFTHKSIRAGFLKKCDSKKINNEILSHFKALPDDDPVRISEIVYHTIKANDKRFFIDYILKYEYNQNKSCIDKAVLHTYKQCISDKGKWICDILGNFELFEIDDDTTNFINFISFKLNDKFMGKLYELYIQLDILTDNKNFAEYADGQLQTSNSKRDVSVSYEVLGIVYQNIGSKDNLQKALELYQKALELSEQLSASENTSQSQRDLSISYEKVAGIYEQLGRKENLQKALELYQKDMEICEQLSASENTSQSKRDLSVSYHMVAGIYEQFGGKDNLQKALELYQKDLELSEQLSASENTINAYDDLALSLYKVAMHEYTDKQTKKQLLTRAVQTAKMLYDNLPNERYETFVEVFGEELNNTDK